ncbi:hypothetical protein AG1IA_04635 [Rhizoctonia solani AG-1 IA]|uniref:Uncharacterized protein n=1 Tax=Thanatephorus cucumeris (strain AG1-IA) TaxID=983506 RepID=L8WWZ5_THACA|nr:hypothetical protein AG1IA_04635 [Rhizoctonia solani AG-1 IA]
MSGPPGTSDKKYICPFWPTFQLEPMPLNEPGTNDVPGATPGIALSAFQLVPVPRLFSDSGLNEVPIPNPSDMGVPDQFPGVPPVKGMSPAPIRVPELPRKLNASPPCIRGFRIGTAAEVNRQQQCPTKQAARSTACAERVSKTVEMGLVGVGCNWDPRSETQCNGPNPESARGSGPPPANHPDKTKRCTQNPWEDTRSVPNRFADILLRGVALSHMTRYGECTHPLHLATIFPPKFIFYMRQRTFDGVYNGVVRPAYKISLLSGRPDGFCLNNIGPHLDPKSTDQD